MVHSRAGASAQRKVGDGARSIAQLPKIQSACWQPLAKPQRPLTR